MKACRELSKRVLQDLFRFLDGLEARWRDESEYEPWDEYTVAARRRVEDEGFVFLSLTRRPFQLSFQDTAKVYTMKVSAKGITLSERAA